MLVFISVFFCTFPLHQSPKTGGGFFAPNSEPLGFESEAEATQIQTAPPKNENANDYKTGGGSFAPNSKPFRFESEAGGTTRAQATTQPTNENEKDESATSVVLFVSCGGHREVNCINCPDRAPSEDKMLYYIVILLFLLLYYIAILLYYYYMLYYIAPSEDKRLYYIAILEV